MSFTKGNPLVADVSEVNGNGQGSDEVVPPAERIRRALLTGAEVKALPPPVSLVDGYLYENSLAMVYGPAGVCKTFLALDWAHHVAQGAWWHGHEVHRGGVLYVVGEGVDGLGLRIGAWERHHQAHGGVEGVTYLPWAVNVHDPAWAGALAEVVAELTPTLVVLDTLARCTPGADENSARDMGLVVAHLDQIREAARSCVLMVHHSGKDLSAGGRGSTAIRGAVTTELELTGDHRTLTLLNKKQKDSPEAPPLLLQLRQVPGSQSAVIAPFVPVPELAPPPPPPAAATLAVLASIDVETGITTAEWKRISGLADRTFYHHRKELADGGHVVNVGTSATPKYRPASAVEVEPEPEETSPDEPCQLPLPGSTANCHPL